MPLHIANYFECDRLSAIAGEALTPGMIVKVSDHGDGQRELNAVDDGDTALLVAGNYAIVTKELLDPNEVSESTAAADTGIRMLSTIALGDDCLELRRGVQCEYSTDLLDDSLDPGAETPGTLPAVGDSLAVKGALFCAADVVGAITSPVVGRVTRVFGTGATAKVVIELV